MKFIGIKINKKIIISKAIKQNDHNIEKGKRKIIYRINFSHCIFMYVSLHTHLSTFTLVFLESKSMWMFWKVLIGPLNAIKHFISRLNLHNRIYCVVHELCVYTLCTSKCRLKCIYDFDLPNLDIPLIIKYRDYK